MAEYHVESFGCRASQADGDAIAAQLRTAGLTPARAVTSASIIVVNTCTVTAEADRSARSYLRRIQRQNPAARIVVTGCYAQRAPSEVAALTGVHAVVGNSHKHRAAETALQLLPAPSLAPSNFVPLTALQTSSRISAQPAAAPFLVGDIFAHTGIGSLAGVTLDANLASADTAHTRPNLKIQDGCGNRCTFCVIPFTRGNSTSLPRAKVLAAIRQFVDNGGNELVLSGINLGRWGRDLRPADRFEDLLAAILGETTLPRLRISSIEPMDWTPRLIELMGSSPSRIAPHAHLPLQSGSDTILRAMHRRYRPWHYAAKLHLIRSAMPHASIGADVMVGFPGETDALFRETHDFIAAQPLTYLHLFPFSARPGTPGWQLHRQLPVHGTAVNERMSALRTLIEQKNLAFRRQFIGLTLPAITLHTSPSIRQRGYTEALTDNFLRIEIDAALPANQLVSPRILHVSAGRISASITAALQASDVILADATGVRNQADSPAAGGDPSISVPLNSSPAPTSVSVHAKSA